MNRNQLRDQIRNRKSYLCVGLDTDPEKLPAPFYGKPNGVVDFNKAIIEATQPYCVSYKINTAFYEAMGSKGWQAMEETVHAIPATHLRIADAKRGDIGNTSSQYARAFFEQLPFDAITVAPYMGEDSIRPFLEYPNKWTIVLGLTSNKGAADFELRTLAGTTDQPEEPLYETVIKRVSHWGTPGNLMFVIGATRAESFARVRELIPEHFLLVPGVGFQGGSLADVSKHGLNQDGGLLVNASRAILYASKDERFAAEATHIAAEYQHEMALYLEQRFGIIG